MCLLQNEVCPLFFSRHVLKYVLGCKIGWHDLAFFDPVMNESLRQLVLDADNKDATLMFTALDLTFCVEIGLEEVSSTSRKYSNVQPTEQSMLPGFGVRSFTACFYRQCNLIYVQHFKYPLLLLTSIMFLMQSCKSSAVSSTWLKPLGAGFLFFKAL
jgi:hypothetical protein